MENQYQSFSKVLPGRVADSFSALFKGEYGFNTNCARVQRVDCVSFEVQYVPVENKLTPIIGHGDIVFGLENLEEKLRKTIASGNPNQITVIKTPKLDEYSIHY